MLIFKPMVGCKILASDSHPTKGEGCFIGIVCEIDGNKILFKDGAGCTDSLLWRHSGGNNDFINIII